jgi:hypothetical protein
MWEPEELSGPPQNVVTGTALNTGAQSVTGVFTGVPPPPAAPSIQQATVTRVEHV